MLIDSFAPNPDVAEIHRIAIDAPREVVYRTLSPTPLLDYPLLSAETGLRFFLKHENHLPTGALFWLLTGGVAYTSGVLFFVNERMRYAHFIWHLFVLTGTSCHFLALLACAA